MQWCKLSICCRRNPVTDIRKIERCVERIVKMIVCVDGDYIEKVVHTHERLFNEYKL